MPFANQGTIFNPSDLEILQRVFDQVCADRGLGPRDNEQRDDIAEQLLRAFQRGAVSETELQAAIRDSAKAVEHGAASVEPTNPA